MIIPNILNHYRRNIRNYYFSYQPFPNIGKFSLFFFYEEGFIKCPFQLLRSYKIHEENKKKIEQERSSMQKADYHRHRPTPGMQESVSMHKRTTPLRQSRMNQARSEEEEKREEERQETQRPGGLWKERQPNKTKHIGGTKTRPTYLGTG